MKLPAEIKARLGLSPHYNFIFSFFLAQYLHSHLYLHTIYNRNHDSFFEMKFSASLVVVAPTKHVLFVLRPGKGTFPNSHVFPGGALDDTDPSHQHCALRETYEETGLLIGNNAQQATVHTNLLPTYEEAIKKEFGQAPESSQVENHLYKMTRWTTPSNFARRFVTQFYACEVPEKFQFPERSSTGEVEKVEWLTPEEALNLFKQGKISMMPPQFYILTALHEKGLKGAAESVGDRIIEPTIMRKLEKGKMQMDWGKGESGIVTFEKAGNVSSIEYIRANL